MTKPMTRCLALTFLTALSCGTVQAVGNNCPSGTAATRITGKITNNAIAPGSTLGVAAVNLDGNIKLKCGVMGQGGVDATGAIQFVHTLVCDDQVATFNPYTGTTENVHSQITLLTTGSATTTACVPGVPQAGSSGTFYESSSRSQGPDVAFSAIPRPAALA